MYPSRSTHLADVDGGVERVADVHGQVGAQQVPVAGQRVQLHLAQRRAVAEVVERLGAPKACTPTATQVIEPSLYPVAHTALPDQPRSAPRKTESGERA